MPEKPRRPSHHVTPPNSDDRVDQAERGMPGAGSGSPVTRPAVGGTAAAPPAALDSEGAARVGADRGEGSCCFLPRTVNPFKVPKERRYQTFAVWQFLVMIPLQLACYVLAVQLLLWPITLVPMLAYIIWFLFFDKSPINGSRRPWGRGLKIWKHFVDYFPIKLVKTHDLDPSNKYVFGFHPHGIISMSAMGGFGCDAAGFKELFPGIEMHLLTLNMNFRVPFMREWILSHGICAASRRSCRTILERGPGTAVMLVVGGAAEALDSRPGQYELTLNRTGFIRVAMMAGAQLVPVISFGENEIFENWDGGGGAFGRNLRRFQRLFLRIFGFSTPFFHGRGLCNYDLGFMPYRHPITPVVGRPIPVPHWQGTGEDLLRGPGRVLVEGIHKQYVEELKRMWNEHAPHYATHGTEFIVHSTLAPCDDEGDSGSDDDGARSECAAGIGRLALWPGRTKKNGAGSSKRDLKRGSGVGG